LFQSSHWLLQWKRRVFFYNSKEKGPKNFFEGGKIESEEETEKEEEVPIKSPTKLNKKSNGAIKRKIENSSIMMMGGRKTKKAKKF